MRINIYAEEITNETAVITKEVTDNEFGTRTFYGIRLYLDSPDSLHHSEEDDDRSAITFWGIWTQKEGNNFDVLLDAMSGLHRRLQEAINSSTKGRIDDAPSSD